MDPTVIADAARAGEEFPASADELPAATTTVTPALVRDRTAASILALAPPPRLIFAIAGSPGWLEVWFDAIQSRPAMTPDVEPDPEHDRTRTPTTVASFATPYVVPTAVPATWVPWP